jgi:hypothetical protein
VLAHSRQPAGCARVVSVTDRSPDILSGAWPTSLFVGAAITMYRPEIEPLS